LGEGYAARERWRPSNPQPRPGFQRLPNLLARLAQLHQQIDSGQQAAIWRECGVLACTRRTELQLKKKSAIAIKAKANSVASGERFGKGLQNSAEPIKAIDTRAEIAEALLSMILVAWIADRCNVLSNKTLEIFPTFPAGGYLIRCWRIGLH